MGNSQHLKSKPVTPSLVKEVFKSLPLLLLPFVLKVGECWSCSEATPTTNGTEALSQHFHTPTPLVTHLTLRQTAYTGPSRSHRPECTSHGTLPPPCWFTPTRTENCSKTHAVCAVTLIPIFQTSSVTSPPTPGGRLIQLHRCSPVSSATTKSVRNRKIQGKSTHATRKTSLPKRESSFPLLSPENSTNHAIEKSAQSHTTKTVSLITAPTQRLLAIACNSTKALAKLQASNWNPSLTTAVFALAMVQVVQQQTPSPTQLKQPLLQVRTRVMTFSSLRAHVHEKVAGGRCCHSTRMGALTRAGS